MKKIKLKYRIKAAGVFLFTFIYCGFNLEKTIFAANKYAEKLNEEARKIRMKDFKI